VHAEHVGCEQRDLDHPQAVEQRHP
jgi:hypothetical protein